MARRNPDGRLHLLGDLRPSIAIVGLVCIMLSIMVLIITAMQAAAS